MVFDKQWFENNQRILLKLANTWIGKKILSINTRRPITKLCPNSFTVELEFNKYQAEFYQRDFFARNLYNRLKPLWIILHFWDNLFGSKLNFGFDTLVVYPDADPETDTVDGDIRGSDLDYSTVNSGDGTNFAYTNLSSIFVANSILVDNKYAISRGVTFFDTSELTASAEISTVTLSLYMILVYPSAIDNDALTIVECTAEGEASVSGADFTKFNSEKYVSDQAMSGLTTNQYNVFTLNSAGVDNVSKTGVSKFGVRTSHDISVTTPTDQDLSDLTIPNSLYFSSADASQGQARAPKLTVVYSIPIPETAPPTIVKSTQYGGEDQPATITTTSGELTVMVAGLQAATTVTGIAVDRFQGVRIAENGYDARTASPENLLVDTTR